MPEQLLREFIAESLISERGGAVVKFLQTQRRKFDQGGRAVEKALNVISGSGLGELMGLIVDLIDILPEKDKTKVTQKMTTIKDKKSAMEKETDPAKKKQLEAEVTQMGQELERASKKMKRVSRLAQDLGSDLEEMKPADTRDKIGKAIQKHHPAVDSPPDLDLAKQILRSPPGNSGAAAAVTAIYSDLVGQDLAMDQVLWIQGHTAVAKHIKEDA
jgi:hypothetical protein